MEQEYSDLPKEERAKLGYVFDYDYTKFLDLTIKNSDIPLINDFLK